MLRPSNKRITGSLTADYIVPGDHALAQPLNIPVVIVEAEKSALAIRAWAKRTRREILPIATGGCWSWRGRIGKTENSNGDRLDELGPLPELGICCNGRKVYVLLDANCVTKPSGKALVLQLLKQKADVHVLDFPALEGVNGPDDYIGLCGDKAFAQLLDSPPSRVANWRELLICRQTKSTPQPVRILANVLTALRHAPEWDGVLSFDELSQHIVIKRPTP